MFPNEIIFMIFSYFKKQELGKYLILSKNIRGIIIDVLKSFYIDSSGLSLIDLQRSIKVYYDDDDKNKEELPLDTIDAIHIHFCENRFYLLNTLKEIYYYNSDSKLKVKLSLSLEVAKLIIHQNDTLTIKTKDKNYYDLETDETFTIIKNIKKIDIYYSYCGKPTNATDNPDEVTFGCAGGSHMIFAKNKKNNDLTIYENSSSMKKFTNNKKCYLFNTYYAYIINQDNELIRFYLVKDIEIKKLYDNVIKIKILNFAKRFVIWHYDV